MLHTNKDEHLYIHVASRELHSEKNLQAIVLHRSTQNSESSCHSCQQVNLKESI